MTRREVEICNRLGLHARAAARFVREASRFSSKVGVTRDGRTMDGKSILGMLSLAGSRGTRIEISAEGEDAEAAVEALVALVKNRFGEEA